MNFEEQQKYIEAVTAVIAKKILSMKNIDKSAINIDNIYSLSYKSAVDLLKISYNCYGENGLFDEFTAEQLNSNCRVGEFQIFFDDFLGIKIDISRYGLSDLSDLNIRATNDTGDYKIVVVESKNDKTIQIKSPSKELIFQEGALKVLDQMGMHEFIDVKDIDIDGAIKLFYTDINTLSHYKLSEGEKEAAIK